MLNRRSIRIKVLQHIYSYEHNVGLSDDIDSLKSHTLEDLKKSISNIDSFLYQLLSLSLSFRDIDSRKRELNEKSLTKKNKLKFNFSNNKVLEFLGENEKIKSEIIHFKSSLGSEEELIKDWYKLLIKESFFNEYNNLENSTFNDDLEFVRKLILSFFLKNEDINSFFEARNIYWDIDKQIIRSMLKKTFESLNSRDFNTFAIASLSENIEEDIEFACSLYECVVSKSKEFDSYINDFVKNWELDRISRMDLSIIRLGIAEMTSFSYIPVKVTINECIDLAKNFSSQKSGKFVNGLLDVISLNLLKKGQIKKTGKGLIDNK